MSGKTPTTKSGDLNNEIRFLIRNAKLASDGLLVTKGDSSIYVPGEPKEKIIVPHNVAPGTFSISIIVLILEATLQNRSSRRCSIADSILGISSLFSTDSTTTVTLALLFRNSREHPCTMKQNLTPGIHTAHFMLTSLSGKDNTYWY